MAQETKEVRPMAFECRSAGARFDQFVRIEETEVKLGGNDLAHRRFAGAHKAD